MRFLTVCQILVAFGWCLAGCGGKPTAATAPEVGREVLTDLWDVYQAYSRDKGKPPAAANDLKPYAAGAPTGVRVVSDPDIVVLYGTPVGGANVLAYHKDAPTQGGLVLLSDGAIKMMTPDEFKAAPKAAR